MTFNRKLIEVALPLEAINRASTRENFIYRGNPSSVHKWWAQRPLAAARAVLFAQLVDDPTARADLFPTNEMQREERERLHRLIERLVVWENIRDENLFAEAHAEILKSTEGNPPPILDPFAGGGTIPLEAQRLGLEAHASDLNPVAVLINKALIEIPLKFRDQPPAFPGLADSQIRTWKGAEGLAADVRAYGQSMREEAEKRIGHLYPKATLPDGSKAPVIAWIWARTIICPNPACGIEMPLIRSRLLSARRGYQTFVEPTIVRGSGEQPSVHVQFNLRHEKSVPKGELAGTVGRRGAKCIACDSSVELVHIRREGTAGRLRLQLIATVVESERRRLYLPPDETHIRAAKVSRPQHVPHSRLPSQALGFRVQAYGMTEWVDLFTSRQLHSLVTFSDLVTEARQSVMDDCGDPAYADAVATYLAFAVGKLADYGNSLAIWYSKEDRPKNLFARQAIPMVWDFPEVNPFSEIGGAWTRSIKVVSESFAAMSRSQPGRARQASATSADYVGKVISTDPPYYDNIGYADLSDFFYVWLRRSLGHVYPTLLSTMLVPKVEELVAEPYRHGGMVEAEQFFEGGFRQVFQRARACSLDSYPMTVYYAFRQSETDDSGEASTGWETLLDGMILGGWTITSTWPLRSERSARIRDIESNALASSIVISLRPRAVDAPMTNRRDFIAALEAELPDALRKLQEGQIAPVDLPQAAIGPGIAVFSRYSSVLEPDGSSMTVRSALARINEILDRVLNEQEGDFDAASRFAIAWYRQAGYGVGKYGDAERLALSRNTSVETMDRDAILTSRAGKVQLTKPSDLPWDYDVQRDTHTSNWEALHHLIKVVERDGIAPAGAFVQAALSRPDGAVDPYLVKELAHLLFRIAEGNGWTKDALSFNSLVTSWPEILEVARADRPSADSQIGFDFT